MTINELIDKAKSAEGTIHHIYLHHTGGTYKMNAVEKDHYHICIEGDGTVKLNGDLTDLKAHTWRRNTGAIGIAICCGYRASIGRDEKINWGKYPPTPIQIERMAEVVAILAKHLNLPINRLHILTHDEVATVDNYGINSNDPDCRWDLRWLDDPGSGKQHMQGGNVIRGLAIWKQKYQGID